MEYFCVLLGLFVSFCAVAWAAEELSIAELCGSSQAPWLDVINGELFGKEYVGASVASVSSVFVGGALIKQFLLLLLRKETAWVEGDVVEWRLYDCKDIIVPDGVSFLFSIFDI